MEHQESWQIEGQTSDSNMWKLHSIFKCSGLHEAKEKAANVFCKTHYTSIRVVKQ